MTGKLYVRAYKEQYTPICGLTTHGPTRSVVAVTTATQVHVPLSSSLLVNIELVRLE